MGLFPIDRACPAMTNTAKTLSLNKAPTDATRPSAELVAISKDSTTTLKIKSEEFKATIATAFANSKESFLVADILSRFFITPSSLS